MEMCDVTFRLRCHRANGSRSEHLAVLIKCNEVVLLLLFHFLSRIKLRMLCVMFFFAASDRFLGFQCRSYNNPYRTG